MGLKHLDNYEFWTDVLPGQPGTMTSTPPGTSISSGKLIVPQAGTGGALISNSLTSRGTYVFNARLNVNNDPIINSVGVFELRDGGNPGQSGLKIRTDAKLQFYRGTFGNGETDIGAVSPIALNLDTDVSYYDIEGKIVIGNLGSIELRVDGGVQIGPTVADTQETSNSTADSVRFSINTGARGDTIYWDHVILMDDSGADLNGDFIGPVDVVLLPPTGDGFYTDWNLTGAATRWQAVLTADGDTSYISASAVGDKNTFTQSGLPAGSTAVIATGVWVNAREDDAVTRGFKVLMRNAGGTDALGSIEHFLPPTYDYFFQPFEVSPFTGVAWTVSEINLGVEYGVQVTT